MIEIRHWFLFWSATWLIVTLVSLLIAYLVIKAAVRDGIRESGLLQAVTPLDTPGPELEELQESPGRR